MRFLAPHKVALGIGLLALLLGAATNLFLPQLLKRFIETLSENSEVQLSHLKSLVWLTIGVFTLQGIAFYLRSRQFGFVSHRIAGELRAAIYNGVFQQTPSFFDGQRSGDLAARLSSEVQLIQDVLGIRLIVLVRYGLQVLVGTILMGLVSTKLTIALVLTLLVLVAVGFIFSRSLRRASKALNTEVGTLTGLFTEALSGVRFLQAHRSVNWMVTKLDALNFNAVKKGETRVGVSSTFQSFVSFLLNSSLVLLGVYGITLVGSGELSGGDFGAFVSYAAIVAVSFSFLIASISEVSQALGAWERLAELMPLTSDTQNKNLETSQTITEIPTIEFNKVTFAYSKGAEPALKDASFKIASGMHVALVGRSGAGKSTVLSLLLGFYKPQSGNVSINLSGGPLNYNSVRGQVIYVPQDPQLFGLSIRDNLLITAPHATDADLLQALDRARLSDLISAGSDSKRIDHAAAVTLDTIIGERGLTLSSGQRQRLALARAFLSNAKIILLDEPTANLDAENEQAIQAALKDLFVGRTTITVAHRFSTIMQSDLVLVLDSGRVVEQGTPQELSAGKGIFHHLASLQQQGNLVETRVL